ncbi:hypothetical protein F8M41_024356 [Gigaspora margarita]|uniref:Uncharacterized protein n=1 Tax=Gigaspora margarita TaxID=4874 RepID=A0A8H4AAQ1_GIGMA|nr:hypothetical protein F8M41_024356 [Gigaspora margarita]
MKNGVIPIKFVSERDKLNGSKGGGVDVEKNGNKMFIHYQKSSNMADPDRIGDKKGFDHCYENSIGVGKDEHKESIHSQKSVNMDSANNGQYDLRGCCQYGIGVNKHEKGDETFQTNNRKFENLPESNSKIGMIKSVDKHPMIRIILR